MPIQPEDSRYAKLENAQDSTIEENKPETAFKRQVIIIFSLVVLTVVQIIRPILIRVAHKEATKEGVSFIGSVIVLVTEIFKGVLCCIIIAINQKSVKKLFISIYESFTINKYETLKITMPALLFVVQNNLSYFALQRIDATLFLVTYQFQLLTTAFVMMLILGKRFSYLQWLALVIALVGIITVQLGGDETNHESPAAANLRVSDQIYGLTAVLIMCLTTAFGCVYMEAVLKESKADIFLQNIRLSLISLPMAAATIVYDHETIEEHGFFAGWNIYVWSFVLLGVFSGIIVSSAIKYADNIKKGFCQALALGATAIISVLLGDSSFSMYLVGGVSLVVISVILYSKSPSVKDQEVACDLEANLLDKSAQNT